MKNITKKCQHGKGHHIELYEHQSFLEWLFNKPRCSLNIWLCNSCGRTDIAIRHGSNSTRVVTPGKPIIQGYLNPPLEDLNI